MGLHACGNRREYLRGSLPNMPRCPPRGLALCGRNKTEGFQQIDRLTRDRSPPWSADAQWLQQSNGRGGIWVRGSEVQRSLSVPGRPTRLFHMTSFPTRDTPTDRPSPPKAAAKNRPATDRPTDPRRRRRRRKIDPQLTDRPTCAAGGGGGKPTRDRPADRPSPPEAAAESRPGTDRPTNPRQRS